MFGAYDVALLPLALPQIQDDLAIPDAQLSNLVALIRLGALPAFALALTADRLGRRRLLVISLVAFSVLTGLTALAPNATVFVALQFLQRTFVAAAGLLAGVIIIEEFPENARGWGIGVHTALASFGGGAAAVAFALVDIAPFGWRTLVLAGALALLVSGFVGRRLPETERFVRLQVRRSQAPARQRVFTPMLRLVAAYPGRFAAIGVLVMLFNLGGDAALFYDPSYLQQAHGWRPWQISALNLCAGFMAIVGSATAGRWSDRFGRKRTAAFFLAGMPLFILGYYNVFGWLLPVLWAGMLFTTIGASVALGALNAELFPTSYRSTASGAIAVVATVWGVFSLATHGWLVGRLGSPWPAVSVLALLLLLTPFCLLWLPETSGRTLEEIAPDH
jgi:MFS family permease